MSLQVTMEQSKFSAGRTCSKSPSYERQADDCDTTLATIKSSDGGSGAWLFSHHSTAASCTSGSVSQTCIHHSTSNDEVRKRYLHRLGIHDDLNMAGLTKGPAPAYAGTGGVAPQQERRGSFISEGSSLKMGILKPAHNSLSPPPSQGTRATGQRNVSNQDNIILLRRSVRYTMKLKPDPTDAMKLDQLVSKTPRDEGNEDSTASKSPPSKFELSSAWSSLLSKDSASSISASSGPLDGAYDLFSLPSDSSITASRCDSNRSLDNNSIALDNLPSRDESSLSSMRRRRKVSFDSTVKTATIPSRFSYSNRIRTRLWSSCEDIYANAVRNEKEYIFDGKNWRTAREESDFLRCSSPSSSSGDELVHPVHLCAWSPPQARWQQEQRLSPNGSSTLPSGRNREVGNGSDRTKTVDDYSSVMFEME